MISVPAIGELQNPQDIARAIRDLTTTLQNMVRQGPWNLDAPTGGHMQILARGTDGQWHVWSLVSGGGCTISFNDATHVCTISVP